MSEVLWHITMSVDGYIAGRDHEMDWMGNYELDSPLGVEVMRRTGAILAGRRWHDLAIERWDGRHGIYGGNWTGPVFVITHDPPADPPDPEITFLSDGIEPAVATAREAAGGRGVGILGANTAQQAVAAGLVDEIVIHVVPLLLGGGVRLFEGAEVDRVRLERVQVGQSGDSTDLRFRVLR
ncbi:MAG TPA: dihydrofolate reductase family protein [Thermoleophilaceae bacterium]|nr:dihydrofolate reductase family protein [Thermoleophilaceae bacterium]